MNAERFPRKSAIVPILTEAETDCNNSATQSTKETSIADRIPQYKIGL